VEITTLLEQLNDHCTALKRQKEQVEDLRQQLLQATASSHAESRDAAPDRILADIARKKFLHPNGTRYFLDTLVWANEIFTISPVTYRIAGPILPSTSEELLRKRFLDFKLSIRHPLTDGLCVDELVVTWQKAKCFDETSEAIPAVLAVETVSFRPVITVTSLEKSTVFKGWSISSLQTV
jgi:hypothetical protein